MNFKKFHESKNLFDMSDFSLLQVTSTAYRYGTSLGVLSQGTYTFNATKSAGAQSIYLTEKLNGVYSQTTISSVPFSFTADGDSEYIIRTANNTGTTWEAENYSDMMLNTGSQPLPYEPYSSEVWHDTPHYIHSTSTDTITTLPSDIYANDNNATVGLKGQMVQSSTPTPTTPIQPQECGDLETEGAKAGQYKIPISSANTTTPVYLGEVETTRKIKKYEFTGQENWGLSSSGYFYSANAISDYNNRLFEITTKSTHYKNVINTTNGRSLNDGEMCFYASSSGSAHEVYVKDNSYSTAEDFKSYLQQQYAAGTPVTVWYVLATKTTGIVNEPLRKIGNYADTVSGITIPTIAGANTLSVGTTLQPSEVSVNYHGWHPVQSVHERENGAWD